MNEVVKNLILNATSICGTNPDKVLEFVEDQLTPDQYLDTKEFLTWIFSKKKSITHKNLDKRVQEFRKVLA